uniref:Uncharacterized protein n=1 Tax=Plectus sambesii TaxID=2011161 RepID=A0A914XIL6_9BILA
MPKNQQASYGRGCKCTTRNDNDDDNAERGRGRADVGENWFVFFASILLLAPSVCLLGLATSTGLARPRVAAGAFRWSIAGLRRLGRRRSRRRGERRVPAGGRSASSCVQIAREQIFDLGFAAIAFH